MNKRNCAKIVQKLADNQTNLMRMRVFSMRAFTYKCMRGLIDRLGLSSSTTNYFSNRKEFLNSEKYVRTAFSKKKILPNF